MQDERILSLAAVLCLAGCVGHLGESAQTPPPSSPPRAATGDAIAVVAVPGVPMAPLAPGPAAMAPALGPAAAVAPIGCAVPAARLWKLTPTQYDRTIATLIPRAPAWGERLAATLPSPSGGFTNESLRLDLSEPHVDGLVGAAEELARLAVVSVSGAAACATGKLEPVACVRTFVRDFGARAFRRPLLPEEEERFIRFYTAEASAVDAQTALVQLVQAFLLSPHFIFRTELGEGAGGTTPLGSWERASALSYLLGDGPPDAELSAAARTGALGDPTALRRQAERLLAKRETAPGLKRFFAEHLGYAGVAEVDRDGKRFPTFGAVRSQLARETEAFVEEVIWRQEPRLETLLAGRFSMLNDGLAAHYGISGVVGKELRKVDLTGTARAGILTHGSWLALHARADEPDIVSRGRFVRERLLCEEVPPPPPSANAVPPVPDRALTHRQRIEQHSKDPSCAACHRLLDPPGIAFEHYDADGRQRSSDNGKPIDASGRLTVGTGPTVDFRDGIELVEALSRHPATQACFTRRLYEYVQGRPAEAADACALDELSARFATSRTDVRQLIVDLVAHDTFLTRRTP